jgi:Transposase DDE domain
MTPPPPLHQWIEQVTSRFPRLSGPQATVLALWSFGMVLAHSCGLDHVALALACLLRQRDQTIRQRLREFYRDADAKRGRNRTQIDPTVGFASLLDWILAGWPSRRLALALDATSLGDRLTVLAVSVVYRGCAVPVAWTVLRGNDPEAWNPHWGRPLGWLSPRLGAEWTVVVLSDRGLESRALFAAIVALGWHPLMRAKAVGHFRPAGWHRFYPMKRFAAAVGRRWSGRGEAYKKSSARLACTLVACWEPGHDQAWLLLTDLAPQAAPPLWYAMRSWIEQGFKVAKSAGWQWQRARMSEPVRAERLWLAVATATLWLVQVGGAADAEAVVETLPPVLGAAAAGRAPTRRHRIVRRGWAVLLAALAHGQPLPQGRFVPEAWPEPIPADDLLTEEIMNQT